MLVLRVYIPKCIISFEGGDTESPFNFQKAMIVANAGIPALSSLTSSGITFASRLLYIQPSTQTETKKGTISVILNVHQCRLIRFFYSPEAVETT